LVLVVVQKLAVITNKVVVEEDWVGQITLV
jgi:hypothetical protein